jgi:hypothetical protein
MFAWFGALFPAAIILFLAWVLSGGTLEGAV